MVRAVESLADEFEDPTLDFLFSSAETLHANFYHGFLDEDDVQRHRDRVNMFVNRMLELTDEQNETEN